MVLVPIKKLSSSPAFVAIDIAEQPASGQVRMARKILQGGAKDMARSVTYTFACFGIKRSGASAGISAEGDAAQEALENFVSELSTQAEAGALHLHSAKGVSPEVFTGLTQAAGLDVEGNAAAHVAGVVAAAKWAMGGSLQGKRFVIEGAALGPVPAAVSDALVGEGAELVSIDGVAKKPWMLWGADVDVILAGSKLGALNHQGAEMVKANAIVPWATTPVTTKAFAILRRAGVVVVPDFVSASGGLVAPYLDVSGEAVAQEVSEQVTAILQEADKSEDGVLLGACVLAEAFLSTWLDKLPFGRPLAS